MQAPVGRRCARRRMRTWNFVASSDASHIFAGGASVAPVRSRSHRSVERDQATRRAQRRHGCSNWSPSPRRRVLGDPRHGVSPSPTTPVGLGGGQHVAGLRTGPRCTPRRRRRQLERARIARASTLSPAPPSGESRRLRRPRISWPLRPAALMPLSTRASSALGTAEIAALSFADQQQGGRSRRAPLSIARPTPARAGTHRTIPFLDSIAQPLYDVYYQGPTRLWAVAVPARWCGAQTMA